MTLPQLITARVVGEYRLWLSYDDGRQGEVDLKDEPAFFFARVVGTGATFSFVQGSTSTSVGSSRF